MLKLENEVVHQRNRKSLKIFLFLKLTIKHQNLDNTPALVTSLLQL